ncbi:MAG: hypothetical protein ABIQ12_13210 [Opitutaceae bacterium]
MSNPVGGWVGLRHRMGVVCGALLLFAWWFTLWRDAFPPLGPRLELEVTFPRGVAGQSEPLITTGTRGNADWLAVRYLDEHTAVLFYDVWGMGGPASEPFPLHPGVPRPLTIEMPTLAHIAAFRSHELRPLRVTVAGTTLLDAPVYFHLRAPADFFFGTNPLGGTLVQERFSGKLATTDGRELRGNLTCFFTPFARLHWLAGDHPWSLIAAFVFSAIAGWLVSVVIPPLRRVIARFRANKWAAPFPPRPSGPPHRWFLATLAASLLLYAAVLTGGTFRLVTPDAFGEQYDLQARSLLQGRLDLPEAARTAESFIFQGRTYIYFGPTPALLRLPFALLDLGFGRLTRCFFVIYFAGCLSAAYLILIHTTRLARGPQAWPSAGATVLFVASAGLGSTMLFLASRAYAYHEAIACGAVFALWSGYATLRWLAQPEGRWWWVALAGGVLAVNARPPAGLFALGLLGWAAIAVALRPAKSRALWRPAAIALLAALGFLSFNAVSYLKFRSFDGAPLRYHVQYDAARLAVIDGRNFHLGNFRHDFDAYTWRPDFTFRPVFPYFYLQRYGQPYYPSARIDLAEPTLALPYAMPALCLFAFGGSALAFARWREARRPLAVLSAGTAPMALALFTAVAISHRYTGDFCPPLVLAGAFGLCALDLLPPIPRRMAWIAVIGLGVVGVLATLAITLHYQGELVWGVPEEIKSRYQMLRHAFDSALGFSQP